MKYETQIGGQAGNLSLEGNRLTYERKDSVVAGEYSCEETEAGCYSVLLNGKSYFVIPLPGGEVSVNGTVLSAQVFDPRDLRGRRDSKTEGGAKSIVALMPGRVVHLLVETGQTVEAGQGLIVIEAMKMQNEMKASRPGTVTRIKTAPGAAVAAGDVLMVIE